MHSATKNLDKSFSSKEPFKVSELFVSFDGEGLRTGELAFFIRLYGCNLDCDYCDSSYAHKSGEFTLMSVEQIVAEATKSNCKNVTVTGGEPLIHANLPLLIKRLKKAGLHINIETNGSLVLPKIRRGGRLFYTCDYKCPCSGMTDKMELSNLSSLKKCDCLKFVVADKADLAAALSIIKEYSPKCFVYFSPVFGRIEPREIAEFMKENGLNKRVRLQLQLHKYVYPPEMRGV